MSQDDPRAFRPHLTGRDLYRAQVSPEELAAKLGLPHHSIKDWEAGKRTPRFNSALRWAAHLDFQVDLIPEAR
jgi:DNA-binding XRE family transcriptional regulator